MSTQNFATLNLTADELAAMDAGLAQLEAAAAGMIALTPQQKTQMVRTGDKSEPFYRQTLRVLEQNPQVLSANMNLPDALADLQASDVLRPRLIRLTQLFQRFQDTDLALRSDVMAMALRGYKLLKVSGRDAGLEPLQRELSVRFAKKRRTAMTPTVPTTPAPTTS